MILLFQLTRSRGAWPIYCGIVVYYVYFNSHAHVERDVLVSVYHFDGKYFNSHAHVERDTIFFRITQKNQNFNSHAHVERDGFNRIAVKITAKFQLTRSRGAWHAAKSVIKMAQNFNSHAHVERDVKILI